MHLSFAIPVVRLHKVRAADFGSETLLSSYPFGPATFRLSLGVPVSGRGLAVSLKKGATAGAVDSEGQEPATLTAVASQRILCELTNAYEHMASVKPSIHTIGGVEAAKLARAGDAADIVVLASRVMSPLEAEGHLIKGGARDFARSEIG
jgi:hypothetical protein